jgi:predicted TIM-barrel fold metal-dependent hydrolase
MTTAVRTAVVDADAHVIETEQTWDHLDPSERKYRPLLVRPSQGGDQREYWVIDGKISGLRFPTLTEQQLREASRVSGKNLVTPQEAREVGDVGLRLRHMDELGIGIQVLYHTLFIGQVTTRPEVDVAICGAWNRWMAGVWQAGGGRLRWACVPSLLSIPDALDQIRLAKQNGAVAVSMRPLEGDRLIVDPHFHPVYEEAERLNLPIAIHIANGSSKYTEVMRSPYDPGNAFGVFRAPTVMACHQLMISDLPERFPKLRWGFVETAAQWLPWVMQEAESRLRGWGRRLPERPMEAFNIWVTLQTDDDIPYLLKRCGDNHFMIGTDYGHIDPSSNIDAIKEFQAMGDVAPEVKQKVLSHNPRAFYTF